MWLSDLLSDRERMVRDLLALFSIALGLRLAYLVMAVQRLGMEAFWKVALDSERYWLISDHLMGGVPTGDYWLFRVGPGYASIIATLRVMFGDSPLPPILLNVLLGALGAVCIYLLAEHLLRSRVVSLIAGGIAALSWTSISLSCHILTDQPAFTLQAAALVAFVVGLRSGGTNWFVLAGILGGLATYIRPTGQFWSLMFVFLAAVVPVSMAIRSRWRQVGLAALSGAIILLMMTGWAARNYVVHGQWTFGTNGVYTVRSCLIARAVAEHTDQGDIMTVRERWHEEDGEFTANWKPSYGLAMARIKQVTAEHPGWVIDAYFKSIEQNIRAMNYYAEQEILQLEGLMKFLNAQIKAWGAYLLLFLTVVGLGWLIVTGRRLAWMLLGLTYLFYTLLTGLSFWQGSRLHYPAEMAWAILVAVAVYQIYAAIRQRLASS